MSEVDYDVEDILAKAARKKGVQSGRKGKRVERDLCKHLNKRFEKIISEHPSWGIFSRTIGSGNRWGQNVRLSQTQSDVFTGDIAVPTNFKWTLESKGGYNDIDLNSAFDGGHKQIDEWIKQVSDDAKRCGRKPMILWKKDFRPRIVIMHPEDVPPNATFTYMMKYREWAIYFFDDVFAFPDDYFFNLEEPHD